MSRDRRAADLETPLLRFLVQSAQDLNSTLKLDEVFDKVARRVRRLIDCQLFCVMLWNNETALLEHSFSLCLEEHVPLEGGFPLGTGISGTCARQREPIRVADVRKNPNYMRQRHPQIEILSEIAVPLVFKDRLIGVIDLESVELDAFTAQHEQILVALASHIATAVENARLYEQVLRDELRLEQDLALAREVQKGLLPPTGPRLDGLEIGAAYQSVRALGGDFYDFQPCGEGRLAVAVGDVSGKGTAAALQGSLAVGILRGHLVEHPSDPSKLLARMNVDLEHAMSDNRFVAMALGVFDSRDRSLLLANAGFTRPFLYRSGQLRRLDVVGMPLGMFSGTGYDEQRLELEPGDLLTFCSDGLLEALNGEGTAFGTSGLEDVLETLAGAPAQALANGILRANTAYAGGDFEEQPDDRSVVVLKIAPVK